MEMRFLGQGGGVEMPIPAVSEYRMSAANRLFSSMKRIFKKLKSRFAPGNFDRQTACKYFRVWREMTIRGPK